MGTSKRRTPRRPSPPGPEGARTACRGKQKTSKSPFGFKWETGNFCPRTNPWLPSPESTSSEWGNASGGGGNVPGALPERRCVRKRHGNIVAEFRSSGV
jgi:hypothetical protein